MVSQSSVSAGKFKQCDQVTVAVALVQTVIEHGTGVSHLGKSDGLGAVGHGAGIPHLRKADGLGAVGHGAWSAWIP